MKNKLLAVFLALCTLLSLTACGAKAAVPSATDAIDVTPEVAEKSTETTNPMNTVSDYKALVSAQPSIKLNDVPEKAENVTYCWISNIPPIDQIDFTLDGHTYCFRAASCPNGTASADISGVYDQLPSVSTVDVSGENQAGGSYVLRYDPDSGKGVANWTSKMVGTQYSLYSDDACKGKIEEMPIAKVMDELFICTQDAKTVSGTVVDSTKNTLALNLDDGSSAVLNCEHIPTIKVAANDKVDVLYLGDIKGDSDVIKIVKTGTASAVSGTTFSGTIFRLIDNNMFVQTSDNNVFSFVYSSSTPVSGAATKLAENEEVVVTYTGDLYNNPTAVSVNVTKVGATPKPTPAPTPAPAYKDGSVTGVVTAACGIWVTVNGAVFEVNSANCYVSGRAEVGGWATINYRDYGNGYITVTSAYFSGSPTPEWNTYTVAGDITAVNGSYVTVNGMTFCVNTSNVEGKAQVGGTARIDYIDYGYGYTEVTYAVFLNPSYEPVYYEVRYGSGAAYHYSAHAVNIGGVDYIINGGTIITGLYSDGCYADVTYNYYPDGTCEATDILFYGAGAGTGTWHDGMYFDGTYYYDDYGNIYDIYGNLVANPYYYDDDYDYDYDYYYYDTDDFDYEKAVG